MWVDVEAAAVVGEVAGEARFAGRWRGYGAAEGQVAAEGGVELAARPPLTLTVPRGADEVVVAVTLRLRVPVKPELSQVRVSVRAGGFDVAPLSVHAPDECRRCVETGTSKAWWCRPTRSRGDGVGAGGAAAPDHAGGVVGMIGLLSMVPECATRTLGEPLTVMLPSPPLVQQAAGARHSVSGRPGHVEVARPRDGHGGVTSWPEPLL